MKTKFIFDSNQRYSGTNTNCTFVIPSPIPLTKSFEISNIEIPHTFYNITSNNNTIRWQDNTPTNNTSTIPAGNYTIDTLLTEIGTQMTADTSDGLTYTATKNDTTKRITITNSGPSNFNLTWDHNTATLNLAKILGFLLSEGQEEFYGDANISGVFPSASSSYTGGNNYFIAWPRNIYIKSNLGYKTKEHISKALRISSGTANISSSQYNIIRKIPVETIYGDTIVEKPQLNTEIYQLKSNSVSQIDFQLLDDNLDEIDLHGQSWSIELIFHLI